jgi:hypothetical protein
MFVTDERIWVPKMASKREPKRTARSHHSRRAPPEKRDRLNTARQCEQVTGDIDQLAAIGDRLYRQHAALLERQHFGQYVIFNTENGKYVVGTSQLDAIRAYRAEYGHVPGWCRGIGFLSRV